MIVFYGVFKEHIGGDERDRTADPLLARQVLSQLSYAPNIYDCAIYFICVVVASLYSSTYFTVRLRRAVRSA